MDRDVAESIAAELHDISTTLKMVLSVLLSREDTDMSMYHMVITHEFGDRDRYAKDAAAIDRTRSAA